MTSNKSPAEQSINKQKERINAEKKWWSDQKARIEYGDLEGYYENYIEYLEEHIKQSGGFSSEYRDICLAAHKATLEFLKQNR